MSARGPHGMGSPPSLDLGSAVKASEFERAQLAGVEWDAAVGVDGQRLASPAAEVLDLVWFDPSQWADSAEGSREIFGADRPAAVLERSEDPFLHRRLAAPEYPSEASPSRSRSKSAGSRRRLAKCTRKMSARSSRVGRSTKTGVKRPSRTCSGASSRTSLAVAMTNTPGCGSASQLSSEPTTRLVAPPSVRADDCMPPTAFSYSPSPSTHLAVVAIWSARLMESSAEPSNPPPS